MEEIGLLSFLISSLCYTRCTGRKFDFYSSSHFDWLLGYFFFLSLLCYRPIEPHREVKCMEWVLFGSHLSPPSAQQWHTYTRWTSFWKRTLPSRARPCCSQLFTSSDGLFDINISISKFPFFFCFLFPFISSSIWEKWYGWTGKLTAYDIYAILIKSGTRNCRCGGKPL